MKRWCIALALLWASAAAWAGYPRTVTDLAGRSVLLPAPPQRIFLQNGNHLMVLALLEREDPFARLAGWVNSLGSSDPTLWALLRQRWPHAAAVPTLRLDADVQADIEGLLALKPDLLVLDLSKKAQADSGPLPRVAERLGIPILYADISRDPVGNVPRTVALLGQVLDRAQRAADYNAFYAERLAALQARRPAGPRPLVFLEARAGSHGMDVCCRTQGLTSWGMLIAAAGGENLGSRLLRGSSGEVAPETLMRSKPDLYLMTGTQRPGRSTGTVPFGYHADPAAIRAGMAALMARPGLALTARSPQACVRALTHQFYDHPLNIVGLQYLARALFPAQHADLDPAATYREAVRRFTTLPDAPFVFEASRRWDGAGCEAPAEPATPRLRSHTSGPSVGLDGPPGGGAARGGAVAR